MSIVLGTEHFFHRAYTKKVAAFTTIFRKVSQNIYFFKKMVMIIEIQLS